MCEELHIFDVLYSRSPKSCFSRMVLGVDITEDHQCSHHQISQRAVLYRVSSTINHNPTEDDSYWCKENIAECGYSRIKNEVVGDIPVLEYKPYDCYGKDTRFMRFLYVLELEENNWYVGITNDIDRRFNEHLSGNGSIWTREYSVVALHEVVDFGYPVPEPLAFELENEKVHELRQIYGDRAGGGEYCYPPKRI